MGESKHTPPNAEQRCPCGVYHYACEECGKDCTAGTFDGPAGHGIHRGRVETWEIKDARGFHLGTVTLQRIAGRWTADLGAGRLLESARLLARAR